MTSIFALWTSLLASFAGPVTGIAITPVAHETSVLIAVDGSVEYRDFQMDGPHRLVVDLIGARHALPRDEFMDLNRGGVRSVRTSQYSQDVVRVVLELDQRVVYSVNTDPRGVRVSFANPAGMFEPWAADGRGGAVPEAAPTPSQPVASSMMSDGSTMRRAQQVQERSTARPISIQFTNTPIQDVLLAFAAFSDRSIIPGPNISGLVTADIRNQPWDVALRTILNQHGLVATEDDYGIIRVDNINDLNSREAIEPIETRAVRVNYATAGELLQAITPLLTERGRATVGQGTNTLIVSDIARVQNAIQSLLRELDVRTPQVSIKAKIIFVNRTDLDDFGVTYEIKDSRGNQFNELSSGGADFDGNGIIDDSEAVSQGESVVLLGGNSVAALGNANSRVAAPTLSLLTSLVLGRHQLISFIDALSTVNLSDVQAEPQTTVLDNQTARLKVGADVPVRTIDAGAGGAGGGQFPTAQVSVEETGIILQVTPHVTNNGNVLLELSVEQSSVDLAQSDVGFIKQTREASTRVLAEDGETVSIGGLTQSERTEVRSGIPLLMDLPIIGRLFRQTREQVVQRDLIILVTPHIVRGSN